MEVSPNADRVEVEYETTHGNQSRISGDVAEVHTKEAMFGDGEKVQAIDIEDASGDVYRVQHTGAVRHQNGSGFRTVGYSGEVVKA